MARRGSRRQAVAAAAAVALFTVIASGWPGFGAKVGGTIAMVPAFLLLLAALAGLRLTARRMSLIAVSGLVLVAGFALVNYFVPATGPSDIGAFVGHVLHGGSGGILQRKVGSNIGSLSENPGVLVIPVVIFAAGLMLVWPSRLGLRPLAAAYRELPLLRPMFTGDLADRAARLVRERLRDHRRRGRPAVRAAAGHRDRLVRPSGTGRHGTRGRRARHPRGGRVAAVAVTRPGFGAFVTGAGPAIAGPQRPVVTL